jgi:serine protease AprX
MLMLIKRPARRFLFLLVGLALAGIGPASTAPRDPRRGHGRISAKAREEGRRKGAANLDVIVRFRDPGAAARTTVRGFGGQVRREHRSRWMAVRLPGSAVERLADNPNVEYIAIDAPVSAAAMDASRATAGLPAAPAPESALRGAGVTIAVIDSGVARRPELPGLVASVDLVGTLDPTYAPAGSVDPNGHGTHVAGIMVGNGSHSQGGALAGIAPAASLVSIRVLDGVGQGNTSTMLAGLQWVIDHKDEYGIRVLNLSLGHPIYEPAEVDPLVQAVEAVWESGIVVVCSAGNTGRDGYGTITSPCNSRSVITVGALNDRKTADTGDDTVATYSSRGPTLLDLVAKPDLLAPGNKIVSVRSPNSTLDLALPTSRVAGDPTRPWDVDYLELSGTSMAAPMVAGAAALMLEQDPTLNPGTVKARLMRSARKGAVGDPFTTGAGALDILAALQASGTVADAPSPLVRVDAVSGELSFENTAVLWSNPAFSLPELWSDAVLWSDSTPLDGAMLSSYGVLLPGTTANALLWPDAMLWPEAMLWPDSTLWSESVLSPDPAIPVVVHTQGALVEDP